MRPLLATSIIALTVVLERLFFILREKICHRPHFVEQMLTAAHFFARAQNRAASPNRREETHPRGTLSKQMSPAGIEPTFKV